ncbi:hypothetical protein WAX46_13100 [Bacillus sp. FJAT-53060]
MKNGGVCVVNKEEKTEKLLMDLREEFYMLDHQNKSGNANLSYEKD